MIVASVSAFAAAPATGTITITNSADGTVTASARTFRAYRILNATETFSGNDTDGYTVTGYAYTIPNANIRSALVTYFNLTTTDKTTEQIDADIVKAIGDVSGSTNIEAMAKALLKIAEDNGAEYVDLTGGTASDQIPFGYYVIKDTTDPEQANVSAVMLDTNNPDVTIKVKASKPTIEKKIDEGATTGRIDTSDLVYDNHRIGDNVPYVLESNIPDMTGYTKYYYYVQDTLSKGLAFNRSSLVIKRVPATGDPVTLTENVDYTLTPADATDGSSATDIEIVFKDFYTNMKAYAGQKLVITYNATVTKDAVIGVEGNPNTAKLIFSNNPNDDYSNEPEGDKPHDTTLVDQTPESKVITYVTGLKVVKVDPAGNRLAGATFELSGNLNKVEVLKEDKFVVANDGTYYLLKNGKYTTTAPSEIDASASNHDELVAQYVDPTGATKYKKVETVTYVEKTADGTPKKVSETTDAKGIIVFDGMGAGDFTLTETQAPTGYNKLTTPIEFTVTWNEPTDPATSTDCTWTVTNKTTGYNVIWDENAGEFVIAIENKNGQELPSTGGMGTTILYIGGSILVLAAAILLITKRRMSADE